MNIQNSNKVPPSILAKADTIWQMDADQLYQFLDDMWTFVPESIENIDDFYGPDLMIEFKKRQVEIQYAEEKERNAIVVVDDVEYKTITFFNMYHLGWESDTTAWIVDKDGTPALVHSSHGNRYFVSDPIAFLRSKITELSNNVKAMKSAVTQLEVNV